MGYYTKYTLEWDSDDLIDTLLTVTAMTKYKALEGSDLFMIHQKKPIKWYQHERDMCWLSLLYKDRLFTLSGKGEEQGDVWVECYKNGEKLVGGNNE